MRWRLPGKRLWLYALVGLGVYLLSLVAFLPASWIAWLAHRASQGTVMLASPNGTLWHGEGDLIVRGHAGSQSLGVVGWRVNPLPLFLGKLAVGLRGLGDADGRANVRLGFNSIEVNELRAILPVQLAGLVYAPVNFFAPTGQLHVMTQRLKIDTGGLHGNADILWRGAGGRFTGAVALGDYRFVVEGRGEQAELKLNTERGQLELTGSGQWHVKGDGQLQFNGFAQARSDAAELQPLLNAMGRDQGGGRRRITFASRAPLLKLLGFDNSAS